LRSRGRTARESLSPSPARASWTMGVAMPSIVSTSTSASSERTGTKGFLARKRAMTCSFASCGMIRPPLPSVSCKVISFPLTSITPPAPAGVSASIKPPDGPERCEQIEGIAGLGFLHDEFRRIGDEFRPGGRAPSRQTHADGQSRRSGLCRRRIHRSFRVPIIVTA